MLINTSGFLPTDIAKIVQTSKNQIHLKCFTTSAAYFHIGKDTHFSNNQCSKNENFVSSDKNIKTWQVTVATMHYLLMRITMQRRQG